MFTLDGPSTPGRSREAFLKTLQTLAPVRFTRSTRLVHKATNLAHRSANAQVYPHAGLKFLHASSKVVEKPGLGMSASGRILFQPQQSCEEHLEAQESGLVGSFQTLGGPHAARFGMQALAGAPKTELPEPCTSHMNLFQRSNLEPMQTQLNHIKSCANPARLDSLPSVHEPCTVRSLESQTTRRQSREHCVWQGWIQRWLPDPLTGLYGTCPAQGPEVSPQVLPC